MRWADLPFRDELQWRFDLALMQNANPHPFVFNVQACEREIVGGVPMVRTRNPDNTEGRRPMDVAVGFHDIHFHADSDNPSGNLSVKPIPHGLGEQALTAPGSPLNHPQGQRVMCKQLHANKMIAHRFTYHARQLYNPNHLIRWDGQSGGGVARPVRPTQPPSNGGGCGGSGEDGNDTPQASEATINDRVSQGRIDGVSEVGNYEHEMNNENNQHSDDEIMVRFSIRGVKLDVNLPSRAQTATLPQSLLLMQAPTTLLMLPSTISVIFGPNRNPEAGPFKCNATCRLSSSVLVSATKRPDDEL